MAAKTGLLTEFQDISAQPETYLKKSVANQLVRRQICERISPVLIRRLAKSAYIKPEHQPGERHAAEPLPPREVPGCFFQPPQSDTWKLQHRSVTFMEPSDARL